MRQLVAFGLIFVASSLWGKTKTHSLPLSTFIPLSSNKTITLHTQLSEAHRVVFEDLHPGANWSHPAEIKVLDPSGAVVEKHTVESPPVSVLSSGSDFLDSRLSLATSFHINDLGGRLRVSEPSNYYAVLINGWGEARHWNDVSFLYQVLTKVYGYLPSNILIFDSNHRKTNADLDGDGSLDINFDSTSTAIKKELLSLKSKFTGNEHLLLVANTHGGRQNSESTLVLIDKEIPVSTFAPWVLNLPTKHIISIYQQCFSGGFVRASVDAQSVALSASTDEEFSWASLDLKFNEFLYRFTSAIAQQNHKGAAIQTDQNGDGFTSIHEAFGYALLTDKRRESPLLESNPNSGLAAKLTLGDPIP